MAVQFDVNTYGVNGTPPAYRITRFLAVIKSMLFGLSWRFGLFYEYQIGSNYPLFNNTQSYGIGNKVQYNFSIYESLTAANTGNNPQLDNMNWILVNQYFIGADERIRYTGKYLNLTYQLNRNFQKQLTANGFTGFKQPPYPYPYGLDIGAGGSFPDIYITSVTPVATSFVMYPDSSKSSKMYPTYSTGYMFTPPVYVDGSTYEFNIHIPVGVYNSLGTTDAIRSAVIREFADKYELSGTGYNILTY